MNSEEYTSFSVALWTCKKTASDFDGRKKDASISSEVLQGGKKNSACLLWLCIGKTTLLAYFHYQYSIFFLEWKIGHDPYFFTNSEDLHKYALEEES
jgi:hypothetical protein